jgi:hypothetical protein
MMSVLKSAGGTSFNAMSSLARVGFGIRLYENYQFLRRLDAILNDPHLPEQTRSIQAFEYLQEMASITPQEKKEIFRKISDIQEYPASHSEQITLKVAEKEQLLLLQKAAYLKRVTNKECLKQIRRQEPLYPSSKSEPGLDVKDFFELKSVINSVRGSVKKNIFSICKDVALMSMSQIITRVASSLFTGPLAVVLPEAYSLATLLYWIFVDSGSLIKNFKTHEVGRFDKGWILLSTALAVTAVTSIFFLLEGMAPMILASVCVALWIGVNISCYYRLKQIEMENIPKPSF